MSLGAGEAIGSDTKTKPARLLTLESPRRQILLPVLDFRRENAIVGKSLQLPAVGLGRELDEAFEGQNLALSRTLGLEATEGGVWQPV